MSEAVVPRKVTIFLPSLRGGGAQRVALQVANGLARKGWLVDLVLATNAGSYFSEVDEKVNLVTLNCRRTVAAIFPLARYLYSMQPTVLLSGQPYGSVIAWFATKLSRWKGRFVVRETNSAVAQREQRGFVAMLMPWLCGYVYRRADVVVAPSRGVASELGDLKTVVIPNPLDLSSLAVKARASGSDLPVGKFVLAVGQFIPQKRFEDLVAAFALLPQRENLSLVILGEGQGREGLIKAAEKHGVSGQLILPGFDPNPFRYMARCAVFVLSSGWEGLPNVLIQALACGAPVVATDCPHGPREILHAGRFGELVSVGDIGELSKAIGRQLERDPVVYPDELLAPYHLGVVIETWEKVLFPKEETK